MVTEIGLLARRFLAGREPLFDRRVAGGRIIDGHGDLLADDIYCLADGPRVLDCLDFDDRLRWLDGLDDAAFLAMDLERLGAPDLARHFTDWYAEYSGDPAPASLRHHYVAYRALVRAKIARIRAAQDEPAAGCEAQQLADIALRHLRAGAVTLVLVGGLPGTGKSTLAGRAGGPARLDGPEQRPDQEGARRDRAGRRHAGDDDSRALRHGDLYRRAGPSGATPSCCTAQPRCWPSASP